MNMETKTVDITLKEAKDLYNQGDTAKTIALKAYRENVLKGFILPNSWKEFCERYSSMKTSECYIDGFGDIHGFPVYATRENCSKSSLPNVKAAKSIIALCQLIQLRDCYNQGWEPNWNDRSNKYAIYTTSNEIRKRVAYGENYIMTFETEENRDKFFDNFKELLETAKELL